MKTLLFLLTLPLAATPITFSCTGSCEQTGPTGFFLNLADYPDYWNLPTRTAEIISSTPLTSITLFVDNLPFLVGAGVTLKLDGQEVWDSLADRTVQASIYLTLAGTAFSKIEVETHEWFGWIERLTIDVLDETPKRREDYGSVPEPGALGLMGSGLLVVWRRVQLADLREGRSK